MEVRHYARDAAVRQKVEALGGRREAQARDVFDIHVLLPSGADEPLLALLAKAVPRHRLKEAQARALAISYGEYRGQVLEFLVGTREVAARAEMTLSNASRDLAMLARDGLVTRIRRGLWAVPGHPDFSPYAVVPRLFAEQEGGYVSLLSALNLHGMIEQIPRSVHVVTKDRRPALRTPVGGYEFYKIQADLFGGFGPYHTTGNFDIATPEKALFDTLYFAARRGRRFAFLPEMELPRDFAAPKIEHWMASVRLPPLRAAVRKRWETVAERAGMGAERDRRSG